MLISAIAFNADAASTPLALQRGDSVAIAGRTKISTWEQEGQQGTGLSVAADHVMSA